MKKLCVNSCLMLVAKLVFPLLNHRRYLSDKLHISIAVVFAIRRFSPILPNNS